MIPFWENIDLKSGVPVCQGSEMFVKRVDMPGIGVCVVLRILGVLKKLTIHAHEVKASIKYGLEQRPNVIPEMMLVVANLTQDNDYK